MYTYPFEQENKIDSAQQERNKSRIYGLAIYLASRANQVITKEHTHLDSL